jgi:hypothetical protein
VRWLTRKTAPATATGKTSISFSKEFDEFGAPTLPQSRFVTSNKETPETLRFRVAMNDFGEIRHCFAINSSGDPTLDEQARLEVIRSRFRPHIGARSKLGSSLVWGIATVQWGSDVVRPQKTAASNVP